MSAALKDLELAIELGHQLFRRLAQIQEGLNAGRTPERYAMSVDEIIDFDRAGLEALRADLPAHSAQLKEWTIYEGSAPAVEAGLHYLRRKLAVLEAARAVAGGTNRSSVVAPLPPLHPRIAAAGSSLYRDGHYSSAVFEASKALIAFVRERSGKSNLDGANLMRTAFSAKNPVLAFNQMADQTDRDEQEGMMHLFEGAVMAIRNPRGHSFLDDSADRATEYLMLLSLLANLTEEATKSCGPSTSPDKVDTSN